MKPPNKRFHPAAWTEKLIPILLLLLGLGLVATLLLVGLSLAGIIPN